jgi:PhnB protein
MPTRLNPYLSFKDNAREAMEFYQSVFGGKLAVSTFKEYHASEDPSEDDKVMHSLLEAENGIVIMGADTPNRMEYSPGARISVSLSGDDEAELRGYWEKLREGGTEAMPLEKAPWGDTFGMLRDRYGIDWLVNISPAE